LNPALASNETNYVINYVICFFYSMIMVYGGFMEGSAG